MKVPRCFLLPNMQHNKTIWRQEMVQWQIVPFIFMMEKSMFYLCSAPGQVVLMLSVDQTLWQVPGGHWPALA